jgi:serine/threonine protein kinase
MIKFGKPTEEDFETVSDVIDTMIRTAFAFRQITVRDGDDLHIPDRSVLPYKHMGSLGVGGQASIELVEDTNTGRLFAHKLFRRYRGPTLEKFRQEVMNEVAIMRRLSSNSHIISLFATYSCNRDFGIILYPVADNGDLRSYLQDISDSGNLATAEECSLLGRAFGCLANGLDFIHRHTIRHKDIKPQNILIHEQRIIYTDFGIALDASQYGNTTTTGKSDAFTLRYCAPEVANCTKRNRKSDIFSLGCVFVDMLTVLEPQPDIERLGNGPYFGIINDLRNALTRMRIQSPLWSDVVGICLGMLEPDLDHRPSAIGLLAEFNALEKATSKCTLRYFCDSCAVGC